MCVCVCVRAHTRTVLSLCVVLVLLIKVCGFLTVMDILLSNQHLIICLYLRVVCNDRLDGEWLRLCQVAFSVSS